MFILDGGLKAWHGAGFPLSLHTAPEGSKSQPIARPRSLITGERMAKIEKGPNWEDDLGGEFDKLAKDKNFDNIQKAMYSQFENTFMMYLPRLCEHCLNPACVATCPSGAIYKREEDGIVLIDQDKCRGWRMCITGCPYKKIYFNWKSGKSEKCIFCYPRIEAGQPTVAKGNDGAMHTTIESSSLETIRHMVASGLGISILPLSAVDSHHYAPGILAVRPLTPPVPFRTVAIAWRASFPRPKAIEILADSIRLCSVAKPPAEK